MGRITAFALDYNRVAIFFLVLIALYGGVIYVDYPKQEDPSINIREAVVTASFPGMSVERVEDLITRKLEEKIREIGQVDYVKSESKTGLSIIHVIVRDEFDDMQPIWQDLRNKMNDVAVDLPAGTLGPVVNDEFGLTAVATVALWADGFSLAEMRDVARDIRDKLYVVKGIRKVELFGVQEERVFLDLDNAKLAQYGISPGVVIDTLQAQNIILPGGALDIRGQSITIEPSGNFNNVEDIELVVIPIPGTERVTPLRDLAKIYRGFEDPPDRPVFFNGRPAVILSVSILEGQGVNAVEFGQNLTRTAKELEAGLPVGYVLQYATYQPDLIQAAVDGAVTNLYQTLVIVLGVVILFLGVRTGLIVGGFVPMAMLMGLVAMSILDVEFQRMSIAAMIIALGMLVDNGIVVAEDIEMRLAQGEGRRDAVVAAGQSLAIPLLTSTLTTIFAFAPIPLAVGGAGEYTTSLGQVIIVVLLSSWFLAMFMTPLLCFWFIKVKPKKADASGTADPYAGPMYRIYGAFLHYILANRLLALLVVVAAFVGSGYLFRFVVHEFFPAGDRNQYLVYIDLPAGSRVEETSKAIAELNNWLLDKKQNPKVTSTVAYAGGGGPRFFLSLAPIDPDPHLGFMVVNTETRDDVAEMIEKTRQHILGNLPNTRGRVKAMWLGATETGIFEIRISGPDADVLYDRAGRLLQALRRIPGTIDEKQDWDNKVVKIEVLVDQARARRASVTSQEVANSLNAYLSGATVTDYREGDKVIPIVVRGTEDERTILANLRDISVFSVSRKTNVPLSQIADFNARWEFSRIARRAQERTITVSCRNEFLKAAQIFDEAKPAIDNLELPIGFHWEIGGELENSAKAQRYLAKNMPLFGMLIVFLLVWQFNSFRRSAIIVATIPLSFIGAVIGLLVMNSVFGFMVILGFLSLAGIIINNGIVLIDRIDIERAGGASIYDAIVAASIARLRPILMTTATTILGLMTLIVARDPLFYGMAVVIAFGLAVGTVLTLGVVPVLYSLFFRSGSSSATKSIQSSAA